GGQLNNIPLQNWDFQSFWHIILNDNHPFLYNLCLKIYAHLLGTSDFVLRFFSAIWILFGAITSYIILYKHHYKSLALLYIIFFLLAPQTIYYAQECRNYAMLLCLTSIFCTLLYLVLESMHDRLKLTHQFWYFLGILLCGTALVLTHYYAYVFVFCVGVVFLLQSILTRKFFIPLFICFGLMGLAGIIWISIHHFYGGFLDRMDTAWVFEYSLWWLLFSIILSCFGKFAWILIACSLLFAFRYSGFTPYRQYAPFLYIVGLEFIIVSLIFLNLSQTMTGRFFIEIHILIYLFIANVLLYSQAFLRYLKPIVLAIALTLTAHSFFISATYHKEDLRTASEYIAKHFDSAQCLLPVRWIAYRRYLPQFEAIEKPLVQKECDLIYLTADREDTNFADTRIALEQHNIKDYKLISFNGAVVVIKEK
ncbi:glycosyltransferase family 39 protein, partial [Helicobacter japonicus]